ncbi:unnamed protein product [Peronospora destructor]|uniref:Aldehyde dehydrogenase domain-containing protein n=1 Tax=Peronospora destructor TaxID=86335 RepID=A0AAV0TZU8_9STRA|nr:unnamed protein product [Peronospora destructor]
MLRKMTLKMVDIGANLTDPVFTGFCRGKQKHESDLTTILTRAKAFGVEKIIVTGGNLEESRKALIKDNESGALPELFSTVGVHPTRCSEFEADPDAYFAELLALCEQGKHDGRVVAIISGADQVAYNRNTGGALLLHMNPKDAAMMDEIFGPVLSVYRVDSFDDALQIENSNDYGNAAAIYTSNGAYAEYFQSRFRAGMIGVNIGIPVPREPFSFGGMYGTKSKYGDMDITGDGCVEIFSTRRKITSKWTTVINSGDVANFSGQL